MSGPRSCGRPQRTITAPTTMPAVASSSTHQRWPKTWRLAITSGVDTPSKPSRPRTLVVAAPGVASWPRICSRPRSMSSFGKSSSGGAASVPLVIAPTDGEDFLGHTSLMVPSLQRGPRQGNRCGAQRVLSRQAGGVDVGVQLTVGPHVLGNVLPTRGGEVPAHVAKRPRRIGAVVALFDVAA